MTGRSPNRFNLSVFLTPRHRGPKSVRLRCRLHASGSANSILRRTMLIPDREHADDVRCESSLRPPRDVACRGLRGRAFGVVNGFPNKSFVASMRHQTPRRHDAATPRRSRRTPPQPQHPKRSPRRRLGRTDHGALMKRVRCVESSERTSSRPRNGVFRRLHTPYGTVRTEFKES